MGMKEEIFSIATALGYDGATPTSKTKAVHAVAEAVESGGSGGGGAAGYDVTITKEWVVEEQTVTTAYDEDESAYKASVMLAAGCDLPQMYEDGKKALEFSLDGSSVSAELERMQDEADENKVYYSFNLNDIFFTTAYVSGELVSALVYFYSDTEPTSHTLSCYNETVSGTTTPEFDHAVAMAETAGKFVVTFNMSDSACDRSFEEITQAWASAKPMAGFLVDGPCRYEGEAIQGVTDVPTFVFTRFDTVMPDVAAAYDRHYIMSAVIDEGSGQPTGWQLTETFGNVIYVNNTPSGQNKWTLNMTPNQIYTAYTCGFTVAFGTQGDSLLPVFMENVTYLNKPMATVESFDFQHLATDSNTLEVKAYHVSTVGGISTMTLTESTYQLTSAS